jgi:hypothetical protein
MTSKRAAILVMLLAASAQASEDLQKNQDIFDALALAGLDEAVVQVSGERVLVAYNQPPIMSDEDVTVAWFYVLGAAARVAPQSKSIVITTSSAGEPLYRVTAKTADVQDYIGRQISGRTLATKLKVEDVMSPNRKCQLNAGYDGERCACNPGYELAGEKCAPKAEGSSGVCCLMGIFSLPVLAAGGVIVTGLAAYLLIRGLRRK